MNGKVTGEGKKTHIQKLQRQPQCWSLTSMFSHSGVLLFLLFPMIVPIPILIPPSYTSIPFWSPYPSLPPPVFLTSAGTLSPTALSLPFCFSHILLQTMLSIFLSFFASVRFSVHWLSSFSSTLGSRFWIRFLKRVLGWSFWLKKRKCPPQK